MTNKVHGSRERRLKAGLKLMVNACPESVQEVIKEDFIKPLLGKNLFEEIFGRRF